MVYRASMAHLVHSPPLDRSRSHPRSQRPNHRTRADLLYTRMCLVLSGSSKSKSKVMLTVRRLLRSLRAVTEIAMIFVASHLSIKRGSRGGVERGSGAMGLGGEVRSIECAGRLGPALRTVATLRDAAERSSMK